MQPLVRVARAAYYNLFVDEIERLGAPIDQWMEESGLPLSMREDPDCYVSSLPFLHFLIAAERRVGIEDMPGDAIRTLRTSTFSAHTHASVTSAVSVFAAICTFLRLSRAENNEQHYWIDLSDPKYLRVRSTASLSSNAYHPNLLQNWAIIRIVRDRLGDAWTPPELAFEGALPPGTNLYNDLEDTVFLANQRSAWVSIPKDELGVTPIPKRAPQDFSEVAAEPLSHLMFPAALRELMKTELRAGRSVSLRELAEDSGTSRRSLQRALTHSGSSFRHVLNEAKSELAADLLREPKRNVTDVAMSLGYADASHFARSFRRATGVSPTEFRRES